jgi:hypothetical protein
MNFDIIHVCGNIVTDECSLKIEILEGGQRRVLPDIRPVCETEVYI